MKDISYLIKFDSEGNRAETYAQYVHYFAENETFVQEKLAEGFIFVSVADYKNLLGNNEDNQIYIRNVDGKYIPKPPYVPTAEEVQEANLAQLDAEYGNKINSLNDEIIVAATVDQDEAYADELRQQRATLQNEYIAKRGEL